MSSSTDVTLCSNSDTTSSSTFSSEALPSLFALVLGGGGGKVEAEEEEEGEETTLIVCVPLSLSLSVVSSNENFCLFLLSAFFLMKP